jgi:cytidine deaminase
MSEQPADPEDAKIVTLARAARARTRAAEGACVRDLDGRTYAGATVALASLEVSAIGVAVSMAVSSAATGLESVAVVTESDTVTGADLGAVRDLAGTGVPVLRCGPDGRLVERLTT